MDDHNERLAIGANGPPPDEPAIDFDSLLDPAVLRDQFELDYAALMKRLGELLAGVDRLYEQHPVILTDEVAGKASDFVKLQLAKEMKKVEAIRKRVVSPFDAAKAVAQSFFKVGILDKLDRAIARIEASVNVFTNAEIARKRKEAAENAARTQAEADRLGKEAERTMRPAALEAAADASTVAQDAARTAEAPAKDLGRVRGTLGSVAAVRTSWKYEVTNLDEIPRELMMLDPQKVEARIADGAREIAGLRIYETHKVGIR